MRQLTCFVFRIYPCLRNIPMRFIGKYSMEPTRYSDECDRVSVDCARILTACSKAPAKQQQSSMNCLPTTQRQVTSFINPGFPPYSSSIHLLNYSCTVLHGDTTRYCSTLEASTSRVPISPGWFVLYSMNTLRYLRRMTSTSSRYSAERGIRSIPRQSSSASHA